MVEDLERTRVRIANQEVKAKIRSTVIDEYLFLENGVKVRVVARDPNTFWPGDVQSELSSGVTVILFPKSEITLVQEADRIIDEPKKKLLIRVGDILTAVRIFGRPATTRLVSIEEE